MIKIELTKNPKIKPDFSNLGFGKYFSDHMFIMNYSENKGWHSARIQPYQPFVCDPASLVFHYAQELFEGMKAYKNERGEIRLFRPELNFARLNEGCERLCIPKINEAIALEGLKKLVETDKDWIPTKEGCSLYIRPTIIANEAMLGVKTSAEYIFYIICSPVASYYANGLQPVKIFVEDYYVRASIGGTGTVKCGGNYAASLIAAEKVKKMGFSQVLWLDALEKKYIEEVGAMNIFFVIEGEVVTPELGGSILPGITRKSVIELCKAEGIKICERKISIDEIVSASQNGTLKECFGTGTAAVISPVGLLHYKGKDIVINNQEIGGISLKLYNKLTGIQTGKINDEFGWSVKL